jgi:hypothetical protein
MKLITVLISWARSKALDIVSFALTVGKKMTGNANFPTPKVPPAAITAAANRLEAAYAARKNGSEAKLEYEDAFDDLNDKLYAQAGYVDNIADGDAMIIASSGFVASNNARTPSTVPGTPAPPKLKTEAGGILHLSIDRVPGALSYLYVLFLGEDVFNIEVLDDYIIMPPTLIKTIIIPEGGLREDIRGLIPGTKVHVQVLAQNTAGKSPFSPLVSTFIV